MFCVYDENEHIIAFHDYLDVVEEYVNNIKKNHNDVILHIGKIKRKKVKKLEGFSELYLVRYAETYVQEGYIEYLSIVSDQIIYDNKYAMDVMIRILEDETLTEKERNTMKKAVLIVNRILKESEEYTPTLENLKQIKNDYDPYYYNRNCYNF